MSKRLDILQNSLEKKKAAWMPSQKRSFMRIIQNVNVTFFLNCEFRTNRFYTSCAAYCFM